MEGGVTWRTCERKKDDEKKGKIRRMRGRLCEIKKDVKGMKEVGDHGRCEGRRRREGKIKERRREGGVKWRRRRRGDPWKGVREGEKERERGGDTRSNHYTIHTTNSLSLLLFLLQAWHTHILGLLHLNALTCAHKHISAMSSRGKCENLSFLAFV